MSYHTFVTDATTPTGCIQGRPFRMVNIIYDEDEWRAPPPVRVPALPVSKVTTTRWQAVAQQPRECSAKTGDHSYIVKIVLRSMNMRLSVAGRTVQDGIAMPGLYHVTEPSAPVRCLFRGPYDVLHLHVPDGLIDECGRDMPDCRPTMLCPEALPVRDPIVEQLGRSLLDADQFPDSFGSLYADCISLAIVTRLHAAGRHAAPGRKARAPELPRWRLKRAIDYVESHLGETVTLVDLALATGLTRMHFAAQFRAATGLRPHEYLLRRRIERAQEMLTETTMSVVDIALTVGFQTQSHFTTVFKRFTGQPPKTWRLARGSALAS
jgi:AraC family transcriptional regulator